MKVFVRECPAQRALSGARIFRAMSQRLPSGTVSFLFTDVEDSTGLAQRLGAGFAALMADHFVLLREATREHRGVEVKSTGDGVFAVFSSASDAVWAAIAMQRAVAGKIWPPGGDVKVRVGVHTGEAVIAGDDYIGLDVHRAARVMAAAHGGQTVVTETTRLLAEGVIEFRDLGRHLLRGLETDESIYQVLIPGLPSEFPPLATASTIPNNLPTRLTPIIGRDREAGALSELLAEHRLVTILGPGGVGKTSLALTVASSLVDSFGGGVTFVDLSSVTDPDFVMNSIAAELKAEPTTLEGVAKHLGDGECLLVLDNFEQVQAAAPQVGRLLDSASRTTVLVTSQVPLRVSGEYRFLLDPLDPEGAEGVRLFFDRARAVAPSFTSGDNDVRELVRYLAGLPLAIELVAARANILEPAQMLERLQSDRMSYGAQADTPERHRTLDDAIGWSYDLLDDSTQRAFRRLGVFAGAMGLDAAEEVIGDPAVDALTEIAELVDRSLLRRVVESSGRFTMLDGIRRHARRLLEESSEHEEIVARYIDFYLATCRDAFAGLQSDRGEWWRAQLDDDMENLRDVLTILHQEGRRGEGLELLGNTWRFHQSRGYMAELEIWLDRFFQLPESGEDEVGTIKGIMARSALVYWQKNLNEALVGYEEAVERARLLDDQSLLAEALYGLAASLLVAGRADEAPGPLAEAKALYTLLGDEGGIADVVAGEAFSYIYKGAWADVGDRFKEAGELYEKVGRRVQATQSLYAQAGSALVSGRLDEAREFAVSGIRRGLELSDVFLQLWGIEYVSRIELDMGNTEVAGLLAGAASAAAETIGGGWSPATIGIEDSAPKMIREFGEVEATRLMEPGRTLSLDEAVELAIGDRD